MHKQMENLSMEQMREIVSKAPSNAESYQGGYYFRESPQFMFHNGFHDQWNLTDNDGLYFKAAGFHPVRIDDLRTAIAEHDTAWMEKRFGIKKWYPIPEHHMCSDKRTDDTTDHITDIHNHVSPSTVVTDLHVNETDKLNRLG